MQLENRLRKWKIRFRNYMRSKEVESLKRLLRENLQTNRLRKRVMCGPK